MVELLIYDVRKKKDSFEICHDTPNVCTYTLNRTTTQFQWQTLKIDWKIDLWLTFEWNINWFAFEINENTFMNRKIKTILDTWCFTIKSGIALGVGSKIENV